MQCGLREDSLFDALHFSWVLKKLNFYFNASKKSHEIIIIIIINYIEYKTYKINNQDYNMIKNF
jgi:hypothetical protein